VVLFRDVEQYLCSAAVPLGTMVRCTGSTQRRARGSSAIGQVPEMGFLSVSRPPDEPPDSETETKTKVSQSRCMSSRTETPKVEIGHEVPFQAPLRILRTAAFLFLGCGTSAVLVLSGFWPSVTERMAIVESYGLGPLYLSLVMLHLAYHTAAAQLGTVFRPTQIEMPDKKVYRILDGGPGVSGALVLTQDGGAFSRYACAQQAAVALEESLPLFVINVAASGFVLPWAAMALSASFGISRASSSAFCAAVGGWCRGSNLIAGLAEGMAAGICLFIGLVATARELSG